MIGVHADNAFDNEVMKKAVGKRTLHIYATEEHVGVVERQIQTLKERLRRAIQSQPFNRYPKILFISLVEHVTEMIN